MNYRRYKIALLVGLIQGYGYGMSQELIEKEKKSSVEQSEVENSVVLQAGDERITLEKNYLEEHWYRQIFEQKLVGERDDQRDALGRYIVCLNNIEPRLLPVLKDVLSKKKIVVERGEYSGTSLVYKELKAHRLRVDEVGQLLLELDNMQVSRAMIAGAARLFIELFRENEIDLEIFEGHNVVRTEINRYFYLMYGKYLEYWPKCEVWLQDLIEFKRLDLKGRLRSFLKGRLRSFGLDLGGLLLSHVCALHELSKYGMVVGGLRWVRWVNLSNNQLESVPGELLRNCPGLVTLNLEKNQLKSVPGELLRDCKGLEELYLNKNQLKTVRGEMI